jgi:quinol-cytochrome oxidoreductase complex cytochrome b subunit
LNWNSLIRQVHRWLSIAFTVGFIVNAGVILGVGDRHPAAWIYLLVLIPLFLLLPTGLYLFALPYVARSRA